MSTTEWPATSPDPAPQAQKQAQPHRIAVLLIEPPAISLWGLDAAERVRRTLTRKGREAVVVANPDALPEDAETVLVLAGDRIFEPALLHGLAEQTEHTLILPEEAELAVATHVTRDKLAIARTHLAAGQAGPVPGTNAIDPMGLAGAHRKRLRKREAPYCLKLRAETKQAVAWRTFTGAYKGVTDLVTKYWWPRPAFHVTGWCARLGMTPNMVTGLGFILMLYALWAFWQGHFLSGLVAGWIMTFLDTVDGKLARVTVTASEFGNAFDHGIDLIHPPFWYAAWAIGLGGTAYALDPGWVTPLITIIFLGYIAGRLIEGVFKWTFGLEIHTWRKLDSQFRLITARRNPMLILMTGFWALGRPDWAILSVALWTLLSTLFHLIRLAQAAWTHRNTGTLTSWLDAPTPSASG